MSPFDVEAVFREEMDKAVAEEVKASGFPVGEWFWSGPREPWEAVAKWYDDGPDMVRNFITWYEANPDVTIWIAPDGQPGIELGIEAMFGQVEVRMVIDLVLQVGTALVVTDLKTSAKAPANSRQVAIYACGLELKYGVRPRYGTFFMNRGLGRSDKQYFLRPVELDKPQYSVPYLAREFELAEKAIQAGAFQASPGDACGRCGVAYACTEAGGDKARQLDPNWPGVSRG